MVHHERPVESQL